MAALVVGVIAPAVAPTLDHWLNSDETFHGAVLSTAGETIPGASVNLITIGAVSTNALGQYEITVPRSRTLKEYKLQVKATGFETPPVLTKSAADMQNLEIRLTPAPPELVKALEPGLMAGQTSACPCTGDAARGERWRLPDHHQRSPGHLGEQGRFIHSLSVRLDDRESVRPICSCDRPLSNPGGT